MSYSAVPALSIMEAPPAGLEGTTLAIGCVKPHIGRNTPHPERSEGSTLLHPRIVALGLSFWLGALTLVPDALAQGRPGPGMRMPVGGSLGGSPRPPRLTLPTTPDRPGDGRHRFFPYWPYWPYGYYDYDDYFPDSAGYDPESNGYRPADSTRTGYSETYPSEMQRVPVQPPREVYPVYDTVAAIGPLVVSSTPVSRTMVRLSWRDGGLGAKQVAFFLADSSRNVLTAETVRSPPFVAVLKPPAETAYAGMTVVLPGGAVETQYVPYRGQAR
jgi:hypothetical protein